MRPSPLSPGDLTRGLSPPCLQRLSGLSVAFHFTERAVLVYSISACILQVKKPREHSPWGPFGVRFSFLRAVLLRWRGQSRHSPGPPRLSKGSEVGESVPWARLGRGSNSTWKNVQPKVEPSSAAGNRCTEAFADWINAFPHKERESKIHVDPLALLMKRRQGCRGGGSQAVGKEAFLHRTFPAYAVHLRYLHCPVVL